MLLIFRILFTGLFVGLLAHAAREAHLNLSNDIGNAGNFVLAVLIGIAAAATWAPVLGEVVAGPMTGTLTDGSVSQDNTGLIRWIRRLEARGWRRLVVVLCFVEGVRHPRLPAAFVLGMNNTRPGSWLERVFSEEVFRFNNVANCVRAHDILKLRHDVNPGLHREAEVNLAIRSHIREPRPEAAILAVPAAPPPPPLQRNERIRLFAAPFSGTSQRPVEPGKLGLSDSNSGAEPNDPQPPQGPTRE